MILGLRPDHKLAVLLQVADLARSSFYYQRQPMQGDDKHGDMKTRICAVYAEHKGRYGYRRIAAALCNSMAQPVNSKRVQRLMQQMGLRSLIRAKRRYRHTQGPSDVHVPNVLQRDFHAETPNQKWATDITEFNVKGKSCICQPAWICTTARSLRTAWPGALYSSSSRARWKWHSRSRKTPPD